LKFSEKIMVTEKPTICPGFLLEKIGLLGKRILRSKKNGKTQSLSFRNLARLAIVQEGEVQQIGSPFWGGQYTLKTAELATIKLLLTELTTLMLLKQRRLEQTGRNSLN